MSRYSRSFRYSTVGTPVRLAGALGTLMHDALQNHRINLILEVRRAPRDHIGPLNIPFPVMWRFNLKPRNECQDRTIKLDLWSTCTSK